MASSSNLDDPDLANLQSNFEEQQAKISALREIIRQTEVVNDMKHATAQEKVKNIAQRLTHFKTKVTTSRLNRASSASASSQSLATIDQGVPLRAGSVDVRPDPRSAAFPRGRSESYGMEKCSLLRQQIEQNRLKMAERESSQREIEEKVIEIKHKLEATQQTLVGRSSTGLADITADRSLGDPPDRLWRSVSSHSFLDAEMTGVGARVSSSTPVRQLQHDSEEQFDDELTKFEDSVRQAQVKRKSDEMLERKVTSLEDELHEKERIIDEQLGALSRLVNGLLDEDNAPEPELVGELHNLQMKLLQQSYHISNDEAASRLLESYGYDPLQRASECKKKSKAPAPAPFSEDTNAQQLHDALAKIDTLEQALAAHELEAERMNQQMDELRQSLEEKTIELNVMTANVSVLQEKLKTSGPKPLFPRSADEELETEAAKLRQQLDESNKNMIKCKLKIKQLQKQVDTFKKTSSVHETVAKLTEENALLVQRLAEAEERAPDSAGSAYDGAGKSVGPELQKRIEMLELTCQNQATAMQLLEEQKNDLSEDLNRTRTELQSLAGQPTADAGDGADLGDNGRIASQMLSIELEEKLEECLADKTELTRVLHSWEAEKSELLQRLKGYADENAELLGRIDKLSLEKVSSAESIEILENLTQREKQEMENSEKRGTTAEGGDAAAAVADGDGAPDGDGTDGKPSSKEDLNESLLKLMEESKELMDKVELFTDERREVLEKLDAISIENQAYICELDKLKEANEQLRTYSGELASAKSDLEDRLRIMNDEKESIRQELATVRDSSVVPVPAAAAAGGAPTEAAAVFDQTVYQQSLVAVETEIANYNKNKDKQKKMQLAKKLTVSAKSMVTMSRQLLEEYGRCVGEREQLSERIALLSQQQQQQEHVSSTLEADEGKDGTISTLEAKLAETVKCLESKASEVMLLQEEIALLKHELEVACGDDEPELLKVELNSKNDEILLLKKDIDALVDAKSAELQQIQQRLLEAQQETHQLKVYGAERQHQLEREVEARTQQIERLQAELRHSVAETATEELEAELQHKQETIDTLNGQIIELYRTVEEHQERLDGAQAERRLVEQKNEELLEKLKKFAANLKKKNVQCAELERELERLGESNRALQEQIDGAGASVDAGEATSELQEANEQLGQKLHHLNNELHRLLEQKYHMEAECAGQRDEVAKLTEQLAAARDELCVKAGAAESLQAELDRCRGEMQTLQDELANKSGKIEKCKVIIKEKIKEAQRLLEWERRAAYLEDELRMTQSNLEDFHNQTLLLGRLKSEKEELNATVRAEHEQCKRLEDRLAELQEELTVANDRDSRMAEQLRHTERWIEQYREKWSRRTNDPTVDSPLEEPPKDVFGWLALLVETDQLVTQTLAEKVNAVRALEARVQETDERTGQLTGEIERLQAELETARSERSQCRLEREQEMERLAQQLATVRTDLERAVADRGALESQQTELVEARDEIERLRADLDAGHEAFEQHRQSAVEREHNIEQLNERLVATQEQLQQALEARKELEESHRCELIEMRKLLETAQQERLAAEQQLSEANESNAELGEECATLRTNVAALEQQLGEERDTIQRLTAANEALRGQLTQLQDSLSVATQGTGWIEAQCEQLRKDHETTQAALADEKRQKEQLNEALKQRDQELDLLRRESDELRARQSEQQSQELDDLKQQLHELDQARASLQTSLDEQRAQCEEQTRELAQLRDTVASLERQTHEDRTNISILTSLNGALNEDLDLLQQQTGEAEQRYQTLLDQCEQKQRALQTVEADLQRQTEAADQRYEQLSGEFEQKCRALEAAEQTLAQEMARKEQLSSALDTKERECAELQRTLEESQASPAGQPEAPKPEPELGMWDDAGWGMGDTARLEETIREKSELIQQLEAEKELMQQEITDLKVKSGKLLRKVKECKVKLDAQQPQQEQQQQQQQQPLRQDPLLEQKVVELEREKEALAVKLELLESACEKLTEVKEHQDRQIEMLREAATASSPVPSGEVDELRARVQQVTATLQMRESEVAHLNARLEQLAREVEGVEELRTQLSELQRWNAQLQSAGSDALASVTTVPESTSHSLELQLAELEHTNRLLEEEKTEMGRELEVLNQQILHDLQFEDRLNKALLELDAKGVEIQMLRSTLDQLQREDAGSAEPVAASPDQQLTALQTRVEELERERAELLQRALSGAAGTAGTELATTPQVDDATVREVLERQELEIVTLKEQLALRSAEYARLAARVDPTKLFASGLSGSESAVPKPEQQQASGDRVPQAELELALYMIYQRDMRCDELELELRNLLQERDTLQLRLSNALRMHEEYKTRLAGPIPGEQEYGTSGECSIDASPDRSLGSLPVDERPISSLSGPQDLTSKLSELQSISYSKEKRWQEEREERDRQLTLIQRDLANMPVEAAAKIAGTDVTADADATAPQQSASTVLLNWILGKK
ncbi:AGAP000035-PA [Anopheles gambiae str. PEST]|uniref:AGAP000035-PA n=1 Tax=Anopheles gambiae TaxID=7165 RepID=A0NCN0_ANOGA|nr:AGAP000035-PA [Anopheles gambiae str. PEST]